MGKIICAVAAHVSSVNSGIEASTEVAARCLGGRSLGQLFVFHSTVSVDSRYQGMKRAFGDDTEIFRVVGSNPPKELDDNDYDKIVSTTLAAAKAVSGSLTTSGPTAPSKNDTSSNSGPTPASPAAAATSPTPDSSEQPIAEELNPYLCLHANFPIIKWGRGVHPWSVTIIYTIIALGSMVGVMLLRWCWRAGTPGIPELLYIVNFIIISGFTFIMLDVKRQVCYVTVAESDLSERGRIVFRELKEFAKEGFPEESAIEESLMDLKHGQVRIDDSGLHVPVMAVRNTIADELASWLTLLNELPGALMLAGLFCLPDDHINWGVAYGVAASVQSRLQRAVAERYIQDAHTRGVFWFKREDAYQYAVHDKNYPLDTDSKSVISKSGLRGLLVFWQYSSICGTRRGKRCRSISIRRGVFRGRLFLLCRCPCFLVNNFACELN